MHNSQLVQYAQLLVKLDISEDLSSFLDRRTTARPQKL